MKSGERMRESVREVLGLSKESSGLREALNPISTFAFETLSAISVSMKND